MNVTVGLFKDLLIRNGLDPRHVSMGPHFPRLVMSDNAHPNSDGTRNDDDRVSLEVPVYLLDDQGHRYIDAGTGEVAVERRVIPLDFPDGLIIEQANNDPTRVTTPQPGDPK